MADSVAYGPDSVISVWIGWRSSIPPAISNKPPAINEQEDDGSEVGGAEVRIEGRAFSSSTLGSSNGIGAAATLRPG